jgi:N-glycosylase/DNA lyase
MAINYKLTTYLLTALIISVLAVGFASAKWTDNGDGTWTLSYKYSQAEKVEIQDCFSTAYENDFAAAGVGKQVFANQKVKSYVEQVVQSCRIETARKTMNVQAFTTADN